MCGFITPLEGSEADEHRKPEVGHVASQLWAGSRSGWHGWALGTGRGLNPLYGIDLLGKVFLLWHEKPALAVGGWGWGAQP